MNHRVKGVTTSSHITVAATASLIVSSLRMWFNPWKLAYGDAINCLCALLHTKPISYLMNLLKLKEIRVSTSELQQYKYYVIAKFLGVKLQYV